MSGILIISQSETCACPEEETPHGSALETGILYEGNASGPTGDQTWYDESQGPSYGCGERYDREETRFMTKVRSKNR